MDFSLSQKDTAKYYILYDDLIKFWSEKLKEKIKPFFLPQILINFDAIGADNAIPIIINVIGIVANESLSIIWDVIIPPSKTTAIGGNIANVDAIQITIKFLLNIK